ncbi:MAG: hypothetical protein NVSMB29_15220 [Candidatus Dormibacteria bacterium]
MVFQRPSTRLWLARQTILAAVVVPLVLGVAAAGATGLPVAGTGLALLAVLASAAIAWMMLRGRYRAWGYCERDDDLLVRRGLLFRQVSVVPYGRMQFVDVSAGPVDRLFGLATVQLHTAAAASDARIPGLLQADADHLRDRLAAIGEARATGL